MSLFKAKGISKIVFLLGLVSLFTDMASEMLYPVMPFYLESIGFSVLGIGLLEGIASATAGLSKGYFGRWSDLSPRRLPFVQIGYTLSAISKPMFALWTNTYWILTARVLDRTGKGVRTGARDALLSQESEVNTRGRIFGFHRSMDTMGASIGPLLAIAFLWFFPGSYKLLFLLAFIPGVLAVISTFFIGETKMEIEEGNIRPSLASLWAYIVNSPKKYKKLVLGLLLFSLINSTDLFLLLYLSHIGMADYHIIWVYVLYNLVFSIMAYPMGIVADKYGLRIIFILGLILFSLVYGGLGYTTQFSVWVLVLFLLYGVYAACTEGVAKAWISNTVLGKEVGSAIGCYEAFNSMTTMLASAIGGAIWFGFGAQIFFWVTSIATLVIVVFFVSLKEQRHV